MGAVPGFTTGVVGPFAAVHPAAQWVAQRPHLVRCSCSLVKMHRSAVAE